MSERLNNTQVEGTPKTIAYIMSRFPKISETFILYEILELQRLGMRVEVFPLIQQHEPIIHAEAQGVINRAHYSRPTSWMVLVAQLYWLIHRPATYIQAWWRAIRGNLNSPKFLVRVFMIVPQAAWFAERMQLLGVEHVHAHYASHPALAAYVVQQLTGIPYSFTAHAHDIYITNERPMLREKVRQASFVVAISDYNKRLISELCGPDALGKIVVIHCGVDPNVFQPETRKQQNNALTIVCVASLEEYKGHPYLIEACAQLKAKGIDIRCLLAGQGIDQPKIEAHIARLGLNEQVIVLGPQPRNRIKEIVAQADVVVLPSVTTSNGKKEGIPVALMEALATGKPVVATAISGIPELIQDGQTGLLVPERDAVALHDALMRIYQDPELGSRLGTAGREKVLKEFNLQSNTAKLHRLLIQDWSVPTVVSSYLADT